MSFAGRLFTNREGKWTPEYQRLAGRSCFEMARVLANEDLTLATSYNGSGNGRALFQAKGAPQAPWKYRFALACLGFRGADRLAWPVREAKRVFFE